MARVKRRKPFAPRCRVCRTNKYVVPVVYGFVNEELIEKEHQGLLKIGGVARMVEAPNWYCKECGNEFLR
ncbi:MULTISPECIES: hypothetical protein [unclassified Nitratiruptor]|uniref:hypothetical protein n=1 Tax=unclassified Nitratiruptor TaxID=2624044 RepID=UPI0019162521|nr:MULTISPECIES: hypothetical protein [unclassified Nitratiruptor]